MPTDVEYEIAGMLGIKLSEQNKPRNAKAWKASNINAPLHNHKLGRPPRIWHEEPEGGKRCARCGIVKPLTDYYVNNSNRTGRRSHYKACVLAAIRSGVKYAKKTAHDNKLKNPKL